MIVGCIPNIPHTLHTQGAQELSTLEHDAVDWALADREKWRALLYRPEGVVVEEVDVVLGRYARGGGGSGGRWGAGKVGVGVWVLIYGGEVSLLYMRGDGGGGGRRYAGAVGGWGWGGGGREGVAWAYVYGSGVSVGV